MIENTTTDADTSTTGEDEVALSLYTYGDRGKIRTIGLGVQPLLLIEPGDGKLDVHVSCLPEEHIPELLRVVASIIQDGAVVEDETSEPDADDDDTADDDTADDDDET